MTVRRSTFTRTNLDDTPKGTDYDLPEVPPPPTVINTESAFAGHSNEESYNSMPTTPSDETPTTTQGALERRRVSSHGRSHGLSSSHRTRSGSGTKELVRLLLSNGDRESREAISLLRRTSERLEQEAQRANEAERRVQEANDRWKLVNQARLQAQADMARATEELRLYKIQLDAAQSQVTRANDLISQTDKERALAEDEAAKARRTAKRYEMELLIKQAKEEGRRMGRREGYEEARFRAVEYRGQDRKYPQYEDGYDEDTYIEDMPVPVPYEDELDDPTRTHPIRPESAPRPRRSLLNRLRGRNGGMDRNVEVNSGAPDIAPVVVDDVPLRSLVSPVPAAQDVGPVTRIQPGMGMPQPDFDSDPAEVPPISMSNAPRTPLHAPVEYPPEGYIPRVDADGSIRLPPPHELGQAPPSPGEYASPLPSAAPLPPGEQMRREPVARDYAEPSRGSRHRHRYTGSIDSSDTSNLSIISPPKHSKLVKEPVLSAIPEASPRHSNRGSVNGGYPMSPRGSAGGGAYMLMSPRQGSAMGDGPVRPDVVGFLLLKMRWIADRIITFRCFIRLAWKPLALSILGSRGRSDRPRSPHLLLSQTAYRATRLQQCTHDRASIRELLMRSQMQHLCAEETQESRDQGGAGPPRSQIMSTSSLRRK